MLAGVDTASACCVTLDFVNRRSIDRLLDQRRQQFGEFISGTHPVLEQLREQLDEYFANQRRQFSIPTRLVGTDFQKEVWQALTRIPYAQTWSYGQLAEELGRSTGSSQAVGRANGQNNIAIVVPCHRVIGADGSLVGYGGGLDRKQWLLDHERGEQRSLDQYF